MVVSKQDPILVIGGGSIGERHAGNLLRLGYHNVYILRTRKLPFRNLDETAVKTLTSWEEVLAVKPKAAFICTPTHLHLEQSIACAKAGMHILAEKPISHDNKGLDALLEAVQESGVYVQIGYMMRYHPLAETIRKWIRTKPYGKLVSFQTYWGEHLPDWHPWEDYRDSYAAKKEMGGGVALTLSHDLDLVLWWMDAPLKQHFLLKNVASSLEVNVDSAVDFLLGFENGVTGHVHLNFFQKLPRREYRLEFEEASVLFSFFQHQITVQRKGENPLEIRKEGFDRNDMFVRQTEDFFRHIESNTVQTSLQNIREAARIVDLCEPDLIPAKP